MTTKTIFFILFALAIMSMEVSANPRHGTCTCKFNPRTMSDEIVQNSCGRHKLPWTTRVPLPSKDESITLIACHCRCEHLDNMYGM